MNLRHQAARRPAMGRPARRARRGWAIVASLAGLAGTLPHFTPRAIGQAEAGDSRTTVEIYVGGMGGDSSSLTITYPDKATVGTAMEDLKAVIDESGWDVGNPVPDGSDGQAYIADVRPGIAAAGSVSPIFPFIHAFRRFPTIEITLIGQSTGEEGDYSGENEFVSAKWTRTGNVSAYTYRMRDRSFRTADEVLLPDTPGDDAAMDGGAAAESGPKQPSTWHLWTLLVLGSIGAGVFGWGLTWWALSRWRPEIIAPDKKGKGPGGTKHLGLSASPLDRDADPVTDDSPSGLE